MEYSNLFGTAASSGGSSTNLSNYYNKQEADALLVQKANLTAGKLSSGEVPDLAITNVVTVPNNTARDALAVEAGDCAIVSSTGLTYMYTGSAWTQIESTQVSWTNVLSSGGQTAADKFALVDTALAAAVTATGTAAPYKYLMRNAGNTASEWTDIQLKSSGGAGTTLTALGTSYSEDGSQLNSQ